MSQIISDYYMKKSEAFDIMIHGNNTQKLNDIVNEVMKITKSPSRIFKPKKGIAKNHFPEHLQFCKYKESSSNYFHYKNPLRNEIVVLDKK